MSNLRIASIPRRASLAAALVFGAGLSALAAASPAIVPSGPAVSLWEAAQQVPAAPRKAAGASTPTTVNTSAADQAAPDAEAKAAGASADWWAAVQKDLAARQYWASPGPQGWLAANPAQGVAMRFTERGVRIETLQRRADAGAGRALLHGKGNLKAELPLRRASHTSQTLAELQLAGIGRGHKITAIAAQPWSGRQAHLERSSGGITEWYDNRRDGIEQGITLSQRPAGQGDLVLAYNVSQARVQKQGNAIQLLSHGHRLAYGKLEVKDADGKPVPARLESSRQQIRLVVADAAARYPLSLDPLLTGTADYTLSSPNAQQSGFFGRSVASAGDVNGDGYADVIVGAYDETANGQTGAGNVYVYLGSASGLSTTPAVTLSSPNAQQSGFFGSSVASAGDVNGDGYADLIVGAAYETANGQTLAGHAYVYLGSASGLSTTPAVTLSSPNAQPGGGFGSSVASAGDVKGTGYDDVIVGAFTETANGQLGAGDAYVYLGSANGLSTTPAVTLSSPNAQEYGFFGASMASAGDVNGDGTPDVIVGAYNETANGQSGAGHAYVYLGSASGLSTTPAITLSSPNAQQSGFFGTSVASAGDVNGDGYADLIVGAYNESANGQSGAGHAYVYLGSASGLSTTPAITLSSPNAQPGGGFGSVASAGDVNGDGYADVIVGAAGEPANGQFGAGNAYVYLGSASGLSTTPAITLSSPNAQEYGGFGSSVASAGDVNGDGIADLIVGARYETAGGRSAAGHAYVYLGSASSGGGQSSSSSSGGSASSSSSGSSSGASTSSGSSSSGGAGGSSGSSSSGGASTLGTTATPTLVNPPDGSYSSLPLYLTITDSTPDATIYYTTDGSTPTTVSTIYTSPIAVSSSETVNAIAAAPGYVNSALASATYTIPVGGSSGGDSGGGGGAASPALLGLFGIAAAARRRRRTARAFLI